MKRVLSRLAGAVSGLWMILAPAAVVGIGFAVVILWSGMTPVDPGPPPPPIPGFRGVLVQPHRPRDPVEMRLFRSRDEVLVFLRRTDHGLAAAGSPLRILDAEGTLLREGATDGQGVFRGLLPGNAASVETVWGKTTVLRPLPEAPEPLPPDLPFLIDRSVIRPGDRVQVLLLAGNGPPPAPRLMLEDGAGGETEGVTLEPAMDPAVEEPWALFAGTVPEDAPPGRARFTAGETLLRVVPVVPRFGEGLAAEDGGGAAPDSPPDPPRERGDLVFGDGRWHLPVPSAEPGATVLFVALSGDRILSHGTAPVERGEAALGIPAATDGFPVVVIAVAMTPRGFLEAEAAAPAAGGGRRLHLRGLPGEPACEVAVAPPGGPAAALAVAIEDPTGGRPFTSVAAAASSHRLELAWESSFMTRVFRNSRGFSSPTAGAGVRARAVAAGGELPSTLRTERILPPGGPEAPAIVTLGRGRVQMTAVRKREFQAWWSDLSRTAVLLRPGQEGAWPGHGRTSPPGSETTWTVVAPPESAGPFRLTGAGGILLEGTVGPDGGSGEEDADDGRTGTMDAALLAKGPLRLEARIPGLRGLLLGGSAGPAPPDAPEAGEGLSLSRSFPKRGRAGETAEAVLLLHADAATGPLIVELPLPGGTVPVEDGWEIRARGPEGVRVEFDRNPDWGVAHAVRWRLPSLPAGETRLRVRLRFAAAGSYEAAAATAESVDPTGPWARSGVGVLFVE